jgi:hypothetical protein
MRWTARLFIALAIMFAGCAQDKSPETPSAETAETKSPQSSASDSDAEFVVYYMTSNVRCASCYKIENWTKEALDKYFAEELKNGKMVFRIVNIEEKEHEHYIEHYEIFTKSVIVSKMADGKEVSWVNLARVWNLLNNQDEFMNYIRDEIKAFMEAK